MAETKQQQIRKRQMAEGYEVAETLAVEEESKTLEIAATKRRKSYNHIISLLADEEGVKIDPETESTSDLSFFMTSLQQELSDSIVASPDTVSDEEKKERVFRHLLEASDDELGLPTKTEETVVSDENSFFSIESLITEGSNEGNLWEIEDEAANYYAMLQSDLFM